MLAIDNYVMLHQSNKCLVLLALNWILPSGKGRRKGRKNGFAN
jgi:hypothetical protein